MSVFIITVFILSALTAAGQFPCGCEKNPPVCHPCLCHSEELKNNAKVFYHYDCDSMYITLLGTTGDTIPIYRMEMEMTGYARLIPSLSHDAQNTVLFNTYCSGGFVSCSWSLIDKASGNYLAEFHDIIYTDTIQNTILHMADNHTLKLYIMDVNKEFDIEYPKEKWEKSPIAYGGVFPAQNYFTAEHTDATHLNVTYRFMDEAISEEWLEESFVIDLNEYLK